MADLKRHIVALEDHLGLDFNAEMKTSLMNPRARGHDNDAGR